MPAVSQDNVVQSNNPTMYQITTERPDGEYTDQELLDLVNYFEVSRVELKNVGGEIVFEEKQGDLFAFLRSESTRYLHSRFSKLNRSIPKHRNYSKVNFKKEKSLIHFSSFACIDDYIKSHGNSLSLKLYSQGDQITLAIASVC